MVAVKTVDELTTRFRGEGLRVTPQRQVIFRLLHGVDTHPTVESLYESAPTEMPTISRKTVYQTVHDLEAMGEVELLDIGTGSIRVDPNVEHAHQHLVCTRCGTVRDVLLDRRPLFWIQHAGWVWALLALCIGAMLFMRARHLEPTERAMQWPDALGLGLFTASGTQIALDAGMPAVIAVILGMVTAVFGGVLRDVVCNEIPRAFNDHRPYAICSLAGGWVLVAAHALAQPGWVSLTLAALVATGLRVAALAWDWRLPAWQASREG